MSKPKKKLTKQQEAKQKELRNQQRRNKYEENAEYRQQKRAESRSVYRNANGFTPKKIAVGDSLKAHGATRNLRIGGVEKKVLSFSTSELAKALDITPLTLYRMQGDNRIPKPHFPVAGTRGNTERAYIWAEVKLVAEVLRDHHSEFIHYRRTHTGTMQRMFTGISNIRKEYKVGKK